MRPVACNIVPRNEIPLYELSQVSHPQTMAQTHTRTMLLQSPLQQLATTICTLYSVAISQCHYHTRQPAAAAPDDLRTTATLELSVYIRTYIVPMVVLEVFPVTMCCVINAVRCTTPRCTPHRNTHNYCEACQYTAVQCEMAILSYNQACCNRK